MKLPEDFMNKYLEDAKKSHIFGIKLDELSKDELMACVYAAYKQIESERNQHKKDIKFFDDINEWSDNRGGM